MSDFGEFTLMYKRSDSADLVRDNFRDIFDKYQFLSNNLTVRDVTIPAASTYTITLPVAPNPVVFAFYVLQDTWPAEVVVNYTTEGALLGTVLVKGLENSNLPKLESETGSFMVFPLLLAGTKITFTNTATNPLEPILKSQLYLVTT